MTSLPTGNDALRKAPFTSCLEICHLLTLPTFELAIRDEGSAWAVQLSESDQQQQSYRTHKRDTCDSPLTPALTKHKA